MLKEEDLIYFMTSNDKLPKGYHDAWGLSWDGRKIYTHNGPRTALARIYLLVTSQDSEEARSDWQNRLDGAQIQSYSYNGYAGYFNPHYFPLDTSEANSLDSKLKDVLTGTTNFKFDNRPIPRHEVEAIANFLEPRIKFIPELTTDSHFYVQISRIDELLNLASTEFESQVDYFQGMFHKRDLEALQVAGLELNISVEVLEAEAGKQARIRERIDISGGRIVPEYLIPVPEDHIFVEIRERDLSKFWEAFYILKDPDPAETK